MVSVVGGVQDKVAVVIDTLEVSHDRLLVAEPEVFGFDLHVFGKGGPVKVQEVVLVVYAALVEWFAVDVFG